MGNPTREDGLYYCGACGLSLVKVKGENCGCSIKRNWLDRGQCGVCGNSATMFFVHGFRCREHEWQKEPSDAIITDKIIWVGCRDKKQRSASRRQGD